MITMNQYILFAAVASVAVLIVFAILRMVVYFVSSIPKWIYVLVIMGVLFCVAFAFFGSTVTRAFGF
jgi:hypothetical protein